MDSIPQTILIASNNAHKLQEFREIFSQFAAAKVTLLTAQALGIISEPEEKADTYAGNARIKALALHELRPDLWVMADDSGLEVDALNGAPGIRSARYHESAPNNDGCAALLRQLAGLPEERRTARFRAVLLVIAPDGSERLFEGVCQGLIGFEKRGTGGFGFDPVFRVAGDDRHFAELSATEKHRISHRGRATRQLILQLNLGTSM
jgi:XTP/dITP diphosphohydrolase